MDKILKPGITLFIIAAIASTLLGYAYEITKEPIALQAEKTKSEAMTAIMPLANDFQSQEITLPDGITEVTTASKDGNITGYIIGTAPKGYGGTIDMLTAIDIDGVITGIALVNMSETPGLGLNANTDEFKNKFIGKSGELSVVKGVASENEIDAMTSATITTQAVVDGVNTATSFFETNVKGGK